jgi:glyceraldehyde-3-phosphate dehydrogenase/erythrose-4-phosphate dehydrogenase
MEVWLEHIERHQTPSIEKLRRAALEVAAQCTPKYVNNLKIELNLDKQKKDVIISMLTINI